MLATGEAFRDLGESYLDQVTRKALDGQAGPTPEQSRLRVMLVPKAA
jgi:hypothetical protein